MNLIIAMLFFFVGLFVHELGHWLMYKYYNKNPTINFDWFAVSVGENIHHELTLKQAIIVYYAGIIAGFPFFIYSEYAVLVYAILCSADIVGIYSSYLLFKKYGNKPMLVAAQLHLDELKSRGAQ